MSEESSQKESDTEKSASSVAAALDESTKKLEELTGVQAEKAKPEIGAATLARMAGLATGSELKVVEGKLDLLSGRVANLTIRVERALTMLGNLPSGNDFERLDVNVASVKTMLKEFVDKAGGATSQPDEKVTKAKLDAFLKRKNGGAKDGDGGETPPAAE